ncbi:RES domain-containing protein [Fulvimarina sp. 2208YS6-2-32]|uniref:RES domain-containing protein n=1 Tax=Fulvimarina uroteuthidis TaxID=3098149 RepID=A0ABU5I6C0_9HYPH|nr:RES domain-containing protein [Fulvimarina sp. 2208YS6-2-32]MDY8110940.1 RES domain-containing protein [Fulvimarina sp. 2208YS6-2-32]
MLKEARYEGLLYRTLNPVYAREPLSGRGAAIHGGRFNARGREALYLSLSPDVALREANQVGTLQPTTLVAYRANLRPVFDTRDRQALDGYGMSADDLANPDWRDRMLKRLDVQTQDFAERLLANCFAGLLVRSFARGAPPTALNLVLWRWNTGADDRLKVIGDEKRLSQ